MKKKWASMTTNYDPIAEQYKRSKQQAWRTFIESFTLMELIGDPAGKVVVDIACGEGFYSRLLRQRGAGKVTAVDSSEHMIELARAQEAEHRLGIDYIAGDARELTLAAEYDLAVAAYLLNYARDRDELGAMCAGIAGCLRPGSRFVTVNCNPALDFRAAPSFRKYGFEVNVAGEFCEKAPISWTFFLEDSSFEIENYFLNVQIHEEAFRLAGFREIRWHRPSLSPERRSRQRPRFLGKFPGPLSCNFHRVLQVKTPTSRWHCYRVKLPQPFPPTQSSDARGAGFSKICRRSAKFSPGIAAHAIWAPIRNIKFHEDYLIAVTVPFPKHNNKPVLTDSQITSTT